MGAKIGWGVLIFNLVVLNLVVGFMVYKQYGVSAQDPASTSLAIGASEAIDQCGTACQDYVDQQIALKYVVTPTPKATVAPSATPQVVYKTVAAAKTRSVTYLAVTGNGSTSSNDWASLGGNDFYFNPADYPGLVEIYFESNMRLFNGNGTAFVRLLDVTHGIGVQGSEVQTGNQASTLVTSGKVTFWAGKNLIRVQAKSLTADTAIFESGRLRIVTEN